MADHPNPRAAADRCVLLDERSRPDFRGVYGELVMQARQVDVAIRRIRLGGMSLGRRELAVPARIRVLLAEINVLALAGEAEALAATADGHARIRLLLELLDNGALALRSAPLGGWAPDFSIFRGDAIGAVLMAGPHWFARPYPHRGPALASVHKGRDAARVARRFNALWLEAHPLDRPVSRILRASLERVVEPTSPASHVMPPG